MPLWGHLLSTAALFWLSSGSHAEPKCDEPAEASSPALLQSKRFAGSGRIQFSDGLTGSYDSAPSFAWLQNQSKTLAPQCQRRKQPPTPLAATEKIQHIRNEMLVARNLARSCNGIPLVAYHVDTSETTCCPTESLECAGCAKYSGKCEKCRGGFVTVANRCVSCLSTVGWTNELNQTCDALTVADCNDRPVNGQSNKQACCLCGGGVKSPTPFQYPDARFVVGADVVLKPLPRTAARYSVNSDCALAAHNLTLDGETGAISYAANKLKPAKAFSVQCEVTAHQDVGLEETVKVSVIVDSMTYGSGALIFDTVTKYSVATETSEWKDFSMICAPDAPWLSISAAGEVSLSATSIAGAVTDTEEGENEYKGMDGAVCVVSALQKSNDKSTDEEFVKRSTTFAAIRPRPWPAITYEASYVEVVVGEELPPMKLQVPSGFEEGMGGLKPSSFHMSCVVDGNWNSPRPSPTWSFDTVWGVGLLGEHSILEILADGTISLAPAATMAKLFDGEDDGILAGSQQRKSVQLSCGVWGSFPGTDFQPVKTPLVIRIKDSMCWISETIQGQVVHEVTILDEATCRNNCRMSKRCSHYTFAHDKCKHWRIQNEGGSPVTAFAKVTDCSDLNTCLRLKHPEWVVAGDYCPVAYDFQRGGPVYRKDGTVKQEVMFLSTVLPGSTSSCAVGKWLVQTASGDDFVDSDMGYFELKGNERACLDAGLPSSGTGMSLNLATMACGKPLFPEAEEDGNGSFIPPPFLIVSGQFACPSRQLMKGAAGIHFESEAESMEPSDCQDGFKREERCKDYAGCQFYWSGTSHGAQTCRLYTGCDSLVREFGMEGDLLALPHNASCQVANPEACWKTSLRRQFLTQTQGTSPSFTRAAAVVNPGGTRSWTGNSTKGLTRETTYIEPFGDLSTIKLLGWSRMQNNMGIMRDVAGISSAVVQGLNPNKQYKWYIRQLPNTNTVSNKLTVNHGSQMTLSQFSRRRYWNKEGTVASTPRGEILMDFEAIDYPLNSFVEKSGASRRRAGIASSSCRRRYRITHCSCIADSGVCTGSKVSGSTCYAYGTTDVHGTTGKSASVRSQSQCMSMTFLKSHQVITSGGPSFSFLESGVNGTVAEAVADEADEADEDDREVSLDAVGTARDEDEEDIEDEVDVADEDHEGLDDEHLGELDEHSEAESSDADMAEEDEESDQQLQKHSDGKLSLLEEGSSESAGTEGWRRRRRTLPSSVSASCPSGQSCTCYPDTFSEKAHTWTISHHCKEVWLSGETCHAKGGYAQAICADIPEPAARSWGTVTKSGSYASNQDSGPTAQCSGGKVMTGCWCKSTSGRGDGCARVWVDSGSNKCYGRTGPGSLSRSHSTSYSIAITARCVDLRTAMMIISSLKIELQQTGLLQTDTPVLEARQVGRLAPLSFHYAHLHQQCDSLLLMGGLGVQHCARPSYRIPASHAWEGKRPLPVSFVHGSQLTASCWTERFQSFRAALKESHETLHCVNGDWYNTLQGPELTSFACAPCVNVAGTGYSQYAKRNEQELYFFSRLAMRVYTELGSIVETAAAAHKFCLKKKPGSSHEMMLENSQECPEILAIQTAGSSEIQERMMMLLDDGAPDNGQCLQAVPSDDGTSPSMKHATCNVDEERQVISPMAIPGIMWSMHESADRNTGEDLHKAFSSYCGAHGALVSLSYGQIFGGDISGIKSKCHFAPVIKFGVFVDSTITYDKTSSDWPDWNTLLADSPILCADGEALTGFKHQPASNKFRYECSRIGGLGAKYEYFSAQVEVKVWDAKRSNFLESLKMITVDCGANGLLSGFHFEFSEGGRWARSRYTCSKAGGAPVVMEPSTKIEQLTQAPEGVFCPSAFDQRTGRFEYENSITGDTLTFQSSGAWCVGSACSVPLGGADPIGVSMPGFEVLNVTDFAGEFEAKGIPKMEGEGAGNLAKQLKKLKPPKRPAQPPKPKLQDFKAKQPEYSAECLDYQDLWKKVVETHVNEAKEPVTEEAKLEADPGTEGEELLDYHPCAVAKSAGGIFGRMAGQSGKMAPENMLYSDWNDCMQGDINRDLVSAQLGYAETAYDLVGNAIQEGIKLVCAMPPDVEIAPLGAGAEVEPDSICDQVTDFVRSMIDLPVGIGFAGNAYALEEEGFNACNPLQVGFSRVFCDIHCVRDAVIRGDRTIIRNLEEATKISNDNMKKMVEWSTEANRVETEYLDKKIDHSLKVNTIYLEHIAQNTQPAEQLVLKNAATATQAMLKEMRGYAEAASFNAAGRHAARSALSNFLKTAQMLNSNASLSQVQDFQNQVQSLHGALQMTGGGLSHAQVVGRQINHEVRQLQQRFTRQERSLGVYRRHSTEVHQTAKGWKRGTSEALLALDHIWWRLRNRLDAYLDVAESEVQHFQASFQALGSYQGCKAGFEDLLHSYGASVAKMHKSHRLLKSTWREVANLLGELAAVIRDGGVFHTFAAAEGCKSPLAKQTLQQARFAVQGAIFLLHRFQAASLPPPDVTVLKDFSAQVKRSYEEAHKKCQK
ncbi:unnamed protein product [Effrenium voratum]|uniref:Uncharacterized protein n=1 Tax=Effrenium voratum TaxID=2562239 RepID=A0AA36JFG9_9DINO|nr:unnamed protein product [Effrenium voratum]